MALLHSTRNYVRRLAMAGYLKVQSVYQSLSPLVRKQERDVQLTRDSVELARANLAANRNNCVDGPVLIDAMWDNPNYWLRLSLLRAALGTSVLEEKALLGRYSKLAVKRTLEKIGISIIGQFEHFATNSRKALVEAKILLAETNTPEEILKWKLPESWPPGIVYDGILKRQANSRVNLSDPYLPKYVAEALLAIEAARCVVDEIQPKLIVLSHCIQFDYGALAWMALARGIPAVVLFGNYGTSRFFRLSVEDDLYDWMSSPRGMDLDALHQEQKELLQSMGHSYLEKRLGGQTDDISANYAFQRRSGMIHRTGICERFGWDPQLPVVAVYAANWFDFPHAFGMRNFYDFHDWLDVTLEVAIKTTGVNWLFKSHPIDERYGGVTLEELMKSKIRSNIRLVPKDWNGNAMMASIDAIVTYHGTSGVEFASMGKPVLLADRGWYHDAGFALWPESREKYRHYLAVPWWEQLDMDHVRERAETFTGFYFCRPDWQEEFILEDDSKQNTIYHTLPNLIENNQAVIEREIDTLRRWWHGGEQLYHTFKMKEDTAFTLPNVQR